MERQYAKFDRWCETKDGRMIGYILHGLDYRDDTNGYHLFTPHGKEFFLCATTLNKLSSEWQTTYNF